MVPGEKSLLEAFPGSSYLREKMSPPEEMEQMSAQSPPDSLPGTTNAAS